MSLEILRRIPQTETDSEIIVVSAETGRYLVYDDIEGVETVRKKLVGRRRWEVEYEVVYKFEGRLWRSFYSVGATEEQYTAPYEFEKEVKLQEVFAVPVTAIVYQSKKEMEAKPNERRTE